MARRKRKGRKGRATIQEARTKTNERGRRSEAVGVSRDHSAPTQKSGWGSLEWPDYEDTFLHAMDYIVRRCLLVGEPPASGLGEAVTTMRVIEAAQESAREHVAVEME